MRGTGERAGEEALALQVLRIVKGWKQAELAAAAKTRPSAVSDYERGLKTPELATLRRLLDAMGANFSTFEATRSFVRAVRRGETPEARESAHLLALEVGNAVARLAMALLEGKEGRQ